MNFEFKLPDLGEGIVEGEVVKWLVKEGDAVKEDEPIVEVMTDKATVEITSPKTGKIAKIVAKEGEIVRVEQVMVQIAFDSGESAAKAPAKPAVDTSRQPQPEARQSPSAPQAVAPLNRNVLASPATRQLARDLNVNLQEVTGTGPGGRVTNEDVQKLASGGTAVKSLSAAPPVAAAAETSGAVERLPFKGLRKKISENMQRAMQHTAHFSYVDTVDMTALVALRNKWKDEAQKEGAKLTYLPFILKAILPALKKFPRFNASLDEEKQEIILKKYYDLGVATATEQGLIVPVLRDVEHKNLLQISRELADLSERTRQMKADLKELKGSTFTITSLGSLGGLFATPIINYPETAIMGIYQIKPTPVVVDDAIVIRQIMYFSLSLNHRVIDGHEAAAFGNEFKKYLEDPKILFSSLKG